MVKVNLSRHIRSDLEMLEGRSKQLAAEAAALIYVMREDECVQDSMLIHNSEENYKEDLEVNFCQIASMYRRGLDVWRAKPISILDRIHLPIRVIYGYIPPTNGRKKSFIVLGVFHRADYDYEKDGVLTERMLEEYDDARI